MLTELDPNKMKRQLDRFSGRRRFGLPQEPNDQEQAESFYWDAVSNSEVDSEQSNDYDVLVATTAGNVRRNVLVKQVSDAADRMNVVISAPLEYNERNLMARIDAERLGQPWVSKSLKEGAWAVLKDWAILKDRLTNSRLIGVTYPIFNYTDFWQAPGSREGGEPQRIESEEPSLLGDLLRLRDGWDGPGSLAPPDGAKAVVAEVFSRLLRFIPSAEVEVDSSNGEVCFSWFFDNHTSSVTVTVLPSERVVVIKAQLDQRSERNVLRRDELARLGREALDAGLHRLDE